MKTYSGSCLCEKVAFEITGVFQGFFLCHCTRCRKGSGSAHGANLFAYGPEFKWLSGQDHVKSFHLEGTRFARSFCGTCGAALPVSDQQGNFAVPAGSLDCDVDVAPNAHIFMGSRANWDKDLELVTKLEGLPT